jgi:hypothetical protein
MKHRGLAKPVMKETAPKEKPVPPPANYEPGWYVSRASRNLIRDELARKTICTDDVPFIFETARTISKLFNRTLPSVYDMQAAVMMKDRQKVQELAEGTKEMTLRRPEAGLQSDEELKDLWKSVAEVLIQRHPQADPPGV